MNQKPFLDWHPSLSVGCGIWLLLVRRVSPRCRIRPVGRQYSRLRTCLFTSCDDLVPISTMIRRTALSACHGQQQSHRSGIFLPFPCSVPKFRSHIYFVKVGRYPIFPSCPSLPSIYIVGNGKQNRAWRASCGQQANNRLSVKKKG